MIKLFRNNAPPTQADADMSRTLTEMHEKISKRRRDLMESCIRGCVAGGLCANHHVQIVSFETCACEGVAVLPFGVAFFTSVDIDTETNLVSVRHGWGARCWHGNQLPLSPPLAHDILRQGESIH